MPYYADSDNTGKIIAFYNNGINSNIPETAIPLTDEEWADAMSSQGKYLIDKINSKLVLNEKPSDVAGLE